MNFAKLIILAISVVIAHGTWDHPYFHRRLPNYPVNNVAFNPHYNIPSYIPMYNPVYVLPMPVNNQQPMPMPVPMPVNNQQPQEQQLTEVEDQKNIE